jgi:uncharacterized oxidoreductase
MRVSGNTVLITGGATGIGLALAKVLLHAGNVVVVCGRREQKLREAKGMLPGLHIRICDITSANDRRALYHWTITTFGELNILINNAGIQREIDLEKGIESLLDGEDEIETNLRAPVHLCALFTPHLKREAEAAIVNITSGLGFVPLAIMPLYCATKSAMHSFTTSLRHQLRKTPVKVFEIVPPTVDTELDKGARKARGQKDRGIRPEEVAEATIQALGENEYEAAVGRAQNLMMGARHEPERVFQMLNPEDQE